MKKVLNEKIAFNNRESLFIEIDIDSDNQKGYVNVIMPTDDSTQYSYKAPFDISTKENAAQSAVNTLNG